MADSCINSATYDRGLLKQFIVFFPTSPIALLLGGYFSYIGLSMFDEEEPLIALEDDPFDTIIVGMILCKLLSV